MRPYLRTSKQHAPNVLVGLVVTVLLAKHTPSSGVQLYSLAKGLYELVEGCFQLLCVTLPELHMTSGREKSIH